MISVILRQTLSDYAKWRPLFDGDAARRRAGGQLGEAKVYRDLDNDNVVTVLFDWDRVERLQDFLKDPALAERMAQAGTLGPPSLLSVVKAA